MANGYLAMLAQEPEMRAGESFWASYNAAQQNKLRQQQIQVEEQRYKQAEAERKADIEARRQKEEAERQAEKAKQDANVMRFVSQLVQSNPAKIDQGRQLLEQRGIQVPDHMQSQVINPELQGPPAPGGVAPFEQREMVANPDLFATDLQGRASAQLGAPKPEDVPIPITDEIAKQVDLGTEHHRGTKEWRAEYNRRVEEKKRLDAELSPGGDMATKLRDKFQAHPVYRDFQEVATAWQKIKNTKATAAGDLAMLINFMKLLDPGSVVREGELWTAEKSRGYTEEIAAFISRARHGTRMTDEQRADFLAQASGQFAAQRDRYDVIVGEYDYLAKEYGARPDLVTGKSRESKAKTRQEAEEILGDL